MYQTVSTYCDKHNVQLIAVSKTRTNEAILEKYDAGQRVFGENRVQELVSKHETLPKDIQWHLIGHLQTNKVKYIAPFVQMIHSVESEKLLNVINKEALKNERIIDVLLQVHVAQEESKFGLNKEAYFDLLELFSQGSFAGIRLRGIMGMASFTNDMDQVRTEFQSINQLFAEAKEKHSAIPYFDQISMGMSGDYKIAVEEGSTMIRVGSLIF